jgi:hypothetical protein
MVTKRPAVAAALMAAFNGLLVLYIAGWIAGVSELRQFSDWRGPLFALFLAIAITAATVIRQIQALE